MRHFIAFLVVLFGALAMVSGCGELQLRLTPAESANVMVLRARLESTDESVDEIVHDVKCNGVAVGPRSVLTAAHCTGDVGMPAVFATSDLWFATAKAFRVGLVAWRDVGADLAVIVAAQPLTHWIPARVPTADDNVVSVVTGFRTDTGIASPTIGRIARAVCKGESGSAVLGADGDVIGVIVSCDSLGGDECDPHGGGNYAPVTAVAAVQ